MAGARFSDVDWQRIWACPKDDPGIYVGQEAPTREFVEGCSGWPAPAHRGGC
jgi:hypothetical protein